MSQITLSQLSSLPSQSFFVTCNGKIVSDWTKLTQNDPYRVCLRVLGGKGGFGSLLRSFRIYRSSNQDMMRDLSGRRMKDVKEETKLKKWIGNKNIREQEKQKKREEKYRKLKEGDAKHTFNDVDFVRTREEILEETGDAVEAGLQVAPNAFEDSPDDDQPGTSGAKGMRKRRAKNGGEGPKPKQPKALWLGIDGLSDEDEDENAGGDEANEDGDELAEERETEEKEEPIDSDPKVEIEEKESTPSPSPPAVEETPIEIVIKEEMKPIQEEPKEYDAIDLESIENEDQLHSFGLDHLKDQLIRHGLKCGGKIEERAKRFYSIKGLKPDQYPKHLLAKMK